MTRTEKSPMTRPLLILLVAGTALSGCTMAPAYERPALPVATAWPADAAAPTPDAAGQDHAASTGQDGLAASAAGLAWQDVVRDDRLRQLVMLALANNRDLKVAVLNIDKARAQYRIQRADLLPGVDAGASYTRSRTPASVSSTGASIDTRQYEANLGVTSYELDLFGRVRSLTTSALQSYLAIAETRRSVELSLIAETVSAYLTLAADREQLAISRDTLATREEALAVIQRRFDAGTASRLALRQSQTLAEQARADVATATATADQSRNALRLLAGAELPEALLPSDLDNAAIAGDLPAGLPAEVLTRRPDVLAAEHELKARNADIGAARAAFFPRITLTGSAGSASTDLDGLFTSGTGAWSFLPQISLPIFAGGANIANLRGAEASQQIAVATYEKTIQTAFREVADALAVRATIDTRVTASERQLEAARESRDLAKARYERGVDDYLVLLDAERTLYSARQTLIQARLLRASNRMTLYKTLGGGAPAPSR